MDALVAKLSREALAGSGLSADSVELDAETREQLRALGYVQ
jgi:hypothetical protein